MVAAAFGWIRKYETNLGENKGKLRDEYHISTD